MRYLDTTNAHAAQLSVQDLAAELDKEFFRRRPSRRLRIRRAFAGEAMQGPPRNPNACWFVLVVKISAVCRLRALFTAAANIETDLTEAECRAARDAIFGKEERKIERNLRRWAK